MPLFLVKWDPEPPNGEPDDAAPPPDGEYEVPEEELQGQPSSGSPYSEWFYEGNPADYTQDDVRNALAAEYLTNEYGQWLISGIAEYEKGIGNRDVPPVLEDAGLADLTDDETDPYQTSDRDRFTRQYTLLKQWLYQPLDILFILVRSERTRPSTGWSRGTARFNHYKTWPVVWTLRTGWYMSGIGNRHVVAPDLSSSRGIEEETYALAAWKQYPTTEQLNRAVEKHIAYVSENDWRPEKYR